MVDAEAFKQVMGRWPSGVTVVTTVLDGTPFGMTASSFSSVSLDPPLISVCVAKSAFSHDKIADAGVFGVNILGADQVDHGKRFAGMLGVDDRFAGVTVETAETGCALLPGAVGWVDCTMWQAVDAGDHSIFIGEVKAAKVNPATAPLLYHSRSWGKFADMLPESAVVTTRTGDLITVALSPEDAGDGCVDLDAAAELATAARSEGRDVHVLARNAFGSRADTPARPEDVVGCIAHLLRLEPDVLILGDEAGAADPLLVRRVLQVAGSLAGRTPIGVAFSSADGMGHANLLTAFKSGVRHVLTDDDGPLLSDAAVRMLMDRMEIPVA